MFVDLRITKLYTYINQNENKVKHRIHIGFDDPSEAKGSEEYIHSEFIRVRDEIKAAFLDFYNTRIKGNE